ncbi:carbohydrate-binding protein [Actinoplanes sp. NPDC049548]|uniref:carbohydrate-binding protein n=1 Tax=Actinoplanes sp. NPDC049548 TaxID=3155152 RepID=UPI00341E4B57
MPRYSAQQQPAWLRPRNVVTFAVLTAGLATAIWLPTRNDSADASTRNRPGGGTFGIGGLNLLQPSSQDSFSDDFGGRQGSTVDPRKWSLEESRTNGLMFRQSTRNAELDGDGNLVITARESDRSGLTSARLLSRSTFRRDSGQVEAKVRVPDSDGLRPAFELVGAGLLSGGSLNLLADPVTDGEFHTYAVAWTPQSVTLSVDGEEVQQVASTVARQAFRLRLSLVVTDADAADLPARMAVDSVDLGALEEGAEEPTTPPTQEPTTPPTQEPTTPPTTPPTQEPTTPPTQEPTSPPATTTPPTKAPTTPPAKAAKEWKPFTDYAKGDLVKFKGDTYEVLEAHTSLPGWEPNKLANLFKKL